MRETFTFNVKISSWLIHLSRETENTKRRKYPIYRPQRAASHSLYNMHWRVRRGTLLAMPARSSRFQKRSVRYNSRFVLTRGLTRWWFNSLVVKHCGLRAFIDERFFLSKPSRCVSIQLVYIFTSYTAINIIIHTIKCYKFNCYMFRSPLRPSSGQLLQIVRLQCAYNKGSHI